MNYVKDPYRNLTYKTHSARECWGDVCPLHKPSAHRYRNKPLFFNGKHMIREVVPGKFVIDPDDYIYRTTGKAIIESSVWCLLCDTKAISSARHEMSYCLCGNVAIDGGYDYQRVVVQDERYIINTSVSTGIDV